jgi:hypothetical protein
MFRANNYTPELNTGAVFRLVGGFLMAPPPYWCADKFMKEKKLTRLWWQWRFSQFATTFQTA